MGTIARVRFAEVRETQCEGGHDEVVDGMSSGNRVEHLGFCYRFLEDTRVFNHRETGVYKVQN